VWVQESQGLEEAAMSAISSPLYLNLLLKGQRGVAFSISQVGTRLTLHEVNAAATERFMSRFDPNTNIIFGAFVIDEKITRRN
jgi:cell division GTPase FtsZ